MMQLAIRIICATLGSYFAVYGLIFFLSGFIPAKPADVVLVMSCVGILLVPIFALAAFLVKRIHVVALLMLLSACLPYMLRKF